MSQYLGDQIFSLRFADDICFTAEREQNLEQGSEIQINVVETNFFVKYIQSKGSGIPVPL